MKFSTRNRYALRLMVDLATCPPDTPASLKEISARQEVSVKYLEQIVTPLTRAGLILSERGAQGGYRLARPAAEITAGQIINAVEGELAAVPCLETGADCPRRAACRTIKFWQGLNDAMLNYANGVTLADFVQA